jgi:hypothetical protein
MAEAPTATAVQAAAYIDVRWTTGATSKSCDVRWPVDGIYRPRVPCYPRAAVWRSDCQYMATYRIDLIPYGRLEDSGMGREGIQFAMEELMDLKTTVWNLRKHP